MALPRLRALGMLPLLWCLLLVAAPVPVAGGEDPLAEFDRRHFAESQSAWTALARSSDLQNLGIRVALTLKELRDLEGARKALPGARQKVYDDIERELEGLRDLLAANAPAHEAGVRLLDEIRGVESPLVESRQKAIVQGPVDRPEAKVRAEFEELQREVVAARARHKQAVVETVARLADLGKWTARLPAYADLDRALEERAGQLQSELEDTFDRVYEREKSVEAALQGDKSALCELVVRGRREEAQLQLRTWQPVRLASIETLDLHQLPRDEGWVDVDAHGTANNMELELPDGRMMGADAFTAFAWIKRKLAAEDLKNWGRAHKDLNFGFRLVSCSTGQKPFGLAQQLANRTGVPVKAPTMTVCVLRRQGQTVSIIHECPLCDRLEGVALTDHLWNSRSRGKWVVFQPGTTEASVALQKKLYEDAKKEPWWQVAVTAVNLPSSKTVEDVLKALLKINARLDKANVTEALTDKKGFLLVDKLTREAAIDRAFDAGRLGLKTRIEVMPRYKENFQGVKTD